MAMSKMRLLGLLTFLAVVVGHMVTCLPLDSATDESSAKPEPLQEKGPVVSVVPPLLGTSVPVDDAELLDSNAPLVTEEPALLSKSLPLVTEQPALLATKLALIAEEPSLLATSLPLAVRKPAYLWSAAETREENLRCLDIQITVEQLTRVRTRCKRNKAPKACSWKCAAREMGLTGPDGELDEAYSLIAMRRMVGVAINTLVPYGVENCYRQHVGRYFPDDESCKSFLPYMSCLLGVMDTVGC